MSRASLLTPVRDYYQERLRVHGPTARGVDWNSEESQRLRFEVLAGLLPPAEPFSLIDYGCGYGALVGYLRARGIDFTYQGFDIAQEMVAEARRAWVGGAAVTFVAEDEALSVADYALASGIFNVRLGASDDDWTAYVLETLERLRALTRRGFAFNALSTYSDPPRRRPDLYYADPLFLFDHCKKRFSPRVALLHDYPLYEFTILVRNSAS